MKRILKLLCAGLITIVLIWLLGRYCWKVVGFRACEGTGISCISVSEDHVEIEGFYPGIFPQGCIGYLAKVEDDSLYFGVNYSKFFGFFETGQFHAVIPTAEEIRKVYLKTNKDEYLIWDGESDPSVLETDFFRER